MQAVRSYVCDFETEAMRDRWNLNQATSSILAKLANKWYIGEPGNNSRTGHYGLFVSDDNGVTAEYRAQSCMIFAYDTISLDAITGNYTLTFDYCAMGNVASDKDGLYLLWIPMTHPETGQPIKFNSNSTFDNIPDNLQDYIISLQPNANMDYLNGTSTWKQCSVEIPGSYCDGTPHYLAFVWANTSNLAQQPGAMIDNIDITDQTPCESASNIQVTRSGTTTFVTWDGTAAEYEVSAYSYDGDSWAGPKIVQGNSTNFSSLAIGQTDFIVRAKCDDYHYSLKTIKSELIYYPDQMCVNYLDLNTAKCYVNNPNNSPNNTLTYSDFQLVKPVDKGPSSMESRHTIHFDRNELETRTGNMAKTIPEGELASVRLGNWDSNDQAERIEFSFDVDTIKYPVLLLKYMPLIEAPGHSDHENPRFKLDMLINNVSIGRCGMADFNANDVLVGGSGAVKPEYAAQGWHKTDHAVAQTSADVVWKEWTTVGVNLRKPEYQGKKLTVRLTTHDCTFSVHSGYAYFTLGCSDGKLKGMKCGEINETFVAPDGFDYRWAYAYNERFRNPDGSMPEQYILSHNQVYEAGRHDDSLYVVDCMFVQDHSCFFSLYASTLATNPITVVKEPKIIRDCRNNIYQVKFDASDSWVQEIDHVKGDTLVSQNYHIESYEWNIEGLTGGWSDQPAPTFNFPLEGGHFKVSVRTTCGTCDSTVVFDLDLEPLGATHEKRTVVLCDEDRKGAGYTWSEKPGSAYNTYGIVDSVVYTSQITSCDSVILLNLVEPYRIYEDTMVMSTGLPFTWHGRTFGVDTKTMVDTVPMADSICDTTYVLNVEIYEPLEATMSPNAFVLCEGGPNMLGIDYTITRGRSLRWHLSFDDPTMPDSLKEGQQPKGAYHIDIPLDENLYPNVYSGSLLLVDSLPDRSLIFPFTVMMQYSSEVIAQRWNDVLAIKNSEYNGGYEFDSVQWYLNGMPIEGATEFNYYTGVDTELVMGGEYQALLTRKADGVKLFTCAYRPSSVPEASQPMPQLKQTVIMPAATMRLQGKGTATWYDMLGRRHHADAFNNSDITAPATAGFYLLVLHSADKREVHRMLVR